MLDDVLSCSAVGGPDTVRESLHAFIERTQADELMITSQIHDHAARMKSYEITARVMQLDPSPALPTQASRTPGRTPM
jgi:alkanesulfonate monooxygenase SsuD/methylene tetrahydromethanopterin reductase-like flavin-dependent oxidoreductase (luciferase family)